MHASNGAASSEHSKLAPSSSATKWNRAVVLVLLAGGVEVMIVSGGIVSPVARTFQP